MSNARTVSQVTGRFVVIMSLAACGGANESVVDGGAPEAAVVDAAKDTAVPSDAQTEPVDAGAGGFDAAAYGDADGVATRAAACTPVKSLGTALTSLHGRLDGYLIGIVALDGSGKCNGDSTHVHMQVMMDGSVYDVAVNADTNLYETDMAMPGGAWSEGWITSNETLDYPSLGFHSTEFPVSPSIASMAAHIETELANVNHVSVFCTGYGPDGCHDVHRQGGGGDGMIVLEPLSTPAHALMFDFSDGGTF